MDKYFSKKRTNLMSQATHRSTDGALYKKVNGSWWKYRDAEYMYSIKFPIWSINNTVCVNQLIPIN